DPIFHVAAGTIHIFVQVLRPTLGSLERGDDKARIGLPGGELRLGHDPSLAAPAVERSPPEILEAARRLAGPPAPWLRPRPLPCHLRNQPGLLGPSAGRRPT